ncbi:unnamed protein product [Orchesella dallaii]|uniref:Lysosomal Pro-X carboxypeptidase n=1 Tax=Orchesella dallaii TaxID=48710 RepID=A0ABP1R4G1_9HEXA
MNVLGYLTVEQALADFAKLITWMKKSLNANSSPVIAFGGSYGGQLTAYLRMKYPHVVQGGIASSAPLFMDDSMCEVFDQSLNSVFSDQSPLCSELIRKSWIAINNLSGTDDGMKWLTSHWKLCDPLTSIENVTMLKSMLIDQTYILYTLGLMGMGNYPYPYPTTFLQDLPANPVKEFCLRITALRSPVNDEDVLSNLYEGVNMYNNNSGDTSCLDYTNVNGNYGGFSINDSNSFDFQSCTQLIDPSCDNGVGDFFEPEIWNYTQFMSTKLWGDAVAGQLGSILWWSRHFLCVKHSI